MPFALRITNRISFFIHFRSAFFPPLFLSFSVSDSAGFVVHVSMERAHIVAGGTN